MERLKFSQPTMRSLFTGRDAFHRVRDQSQRVGVAVLLALWLAGMFLRALATPPMPEGGIDLICGFTAPGHSNFNFYYYRKEPVSPGWSEVAFTTNRSVRVAVPAPDTLFSATALAQSNTVWKTFDCGIAGWYPDVRNTNKMVSLNPRGPWRVRTGEWVKVSFDLKNFTARQRFTIDTNGYVMVEHQESPHWPKFYMAVPTVANPPPPNP